MMEVFCDFWFIPSDILTDTVWILSSLLLFKSIAEFGRGIINGHGGGRWATCRRIWLNEKMREMIKSKFYSISLDFFLFVIKSEELYDRDSYVYW